jgi:flagellar hook-length control protein FliK
VPLAGIAVAIAARAFAGKNHFAIRLDPPELGRIEVHLDVDKDGSVTSHLVADRSDTLNLLQRDSSALQRALQNAGLKTSDNGLQFSLRDQSSYPQPDRSTSNSAHIVVEDDTLPAIKAVQTAQRFAARRGGIDIRI